MSVLDARESLPARYEYPHRDPGAVYIATIHYTAGPTKALAADIARYQTSAAAAAQTGAGEPFPGLAYHYLVEGSGRAVWAHDVDRRTWGSGAVIGGIARNDVSVHICYTGDQQPNDAQLQGIADAITHAQGRLGRAFRVIEGHRDAPYATTCPGPFWPAWRASVIARMSATHPPVQNPGWSGEGFAELWRSGLASGTPKASYSDNYGNVFQESEKGVAVWFKSFNRNGWIPL